MAHVQPYADEPVSTPQRFGLHHVQLAMPVGAEATARRFWIDLIGLTEVTKPPVLAARGGLWLRADHLELHLGTEEAFVPQRKAHPGLVVADLDGIAACLTAAGAPVRWDDDFPGMRRFYTDDPFGNRIEFLCPSTD